jgi:metal-responsive CopG/Arc/MetJ family transcriptional regulator
MAALARTNLTLPEELMREVDELAGPRGRSRYVAEAVAQRVKRDRLGKAIRESAGVMKGKPGAMTPEEVTRWVASLRSEETD